MLDKRENLATKLVTCAAQLRAEEAKPHCVTHADYDINNNAVANELFRSESGVGEHPITCLWQETGVSKAVVFRTVELPSKVAYTLGHILFYHTSCLIDACTS